MKKLFAVLLALTLVLSMGTIALAADGDTTATGTITISNAVEGEEYTIYKMFDFTPIAGSANQGRYSYANDLWKTFVETGDGSAYLEFDSETGTIKWKGALDADGNPDLTAVSELAKKAVAYANATDGITGTMIEATSTTVTFVDLALGYYAVDTTLGAICSLTNTNSTETLIEKNEQPKIVKKIIENNAPVDANNVAIGDKVDYQVTVIATKGTVNYVIHDTMSETLDFDAASVVVKNGENILTKGDDYTLTVPGACGCTFEIDLVDDYELNTLKTGDVITVTYSATLKDNALVGAEGNPNQVHLTYGNAQKTDKDTVLTYTTKFTVEKVDGTGNPLAGAGFTLYKYDPTVEGEDKWVPVGDEIKIDALTDGAKAIYTWNGLEEGQYKLVETKVPDGYNKAKDIEFTITCAEPEKVTSISDKANWDETVSNQVSESKDEDGNALDIFEAKVENKTGSLLPETGGIGTTIFYVVGSILMLAALVLLVSKKRMASFA